MLRAVTLSLVIIGTTFPLLAGAEPCPPCPGGCIPIALVQEMKADAGSVSSQCPAGCTEMNRVKSLQDKPGCEQAVATQPPPAAAAEAEAKPEAPANVLATQDRVVFAPTALTPPDKQVVMTGYGAGLWNISYVVNPNVEVGVYVSLPVVIAGAFPNINLHYAINDRLSVGVGAVAGIGGVYAGEDAGAYGILLGGHAEITWHNEKSLFNLGVIAAGAGGADDNTAFEMLEGAIVVPTAGYRYCFSRNWSFNLEFSVPLAVGKEGVENEEFLGLLTYGVRGSGETLFGDLGFIFVLNEEYMDEAWKYTPLGIPFFSIGMKF